MDRAIDLGASAVVTGSVAAVVSAAALAILARSEGRGSVQPLNATSHWLHGESASEIQEVDLAHTGVGFATHHASAIFWALPFEAWLQQAPQRSFAELLGSAAAVSALAATVDYGITPKRFTPGWENVVSKPSMFAAFAALALGLAGGATVSKALRTRR